MQFLFLYRVSLVTIAAMAVCAAPWYERSFKSSRSLQIENSPLHRRLNTNGLGTAMGTVAATGTAIATGTGNAKAISTGCPTPIAGAVRHKHHGSYHKIPNGCPGPFPISGTGTGLATGTAFATGTGIKAAFGTAASTGLPMALGTGTSFILNAMGTAAPTAGIGYFRRSFNVPYNI